MSPSGGRNWWLLQLRIESLSFSFSPESTTSVRSWALSASNASRRRLVLISASVEAVDDEEAAFLAELRERARERLRADAARRLVAPVPGTRRVRLAAADVEGRADRAVTRAAGALLLVELLGAAADRRAVLGGARALPLRRELRLHDLVEEVLLDLGSEDFVREIDRADLLALHVEDVESCHLSLLRAVSS